MPNEGQSRGKLLGYGTLLVSVLSLVMSLIGILSTRSIARASVEHSRQILQLQMNGERLAPLKDVMKHVGGFAVDGYLRDEGHNEPLGEQNAYRRIDADEEQLRLLFPDANHPLHLKLAEYKSAVSRGYRHTAPNDHTFVVQPFSNELAAARSAFMLEGQKRLDAH